MYKNILNSITRSTFTPYFRVLSQAVRKPVFLKPLAMTKTSTEFKRFYSVVSKTVSLIDFLPSKPIHQKDLHLGFKNYIFLINFLEKAFQALKDGNFEAFDALVGENACQIRAIWVALKAKNCLKNGEATIKQLIEVRKKIEAILNETSSSYGQKSLQAVFDANPVLNIVLTFDEAFLLQSFLLTIAKKTEKPMPDLPVQRNDRGAPEKLLDYGVTIQNSSKYVTFCRKQLAECSVQFMRDQAVWLNDKELELMVSEEYTTRSCTYKRASISYFWSFKIVSSLAMKHQLPIVLRVWLRYSGKGYDVEGGEKTTFIFLQPTPDFVSYQEFKPEAKDFGRVALVVEGVVCRKQGELPENENWKKFLLEHDVREFMLLNSASHRQFVNEKEDYRIEQAPTRDIFMRYKKKAEELGCSLVNPKGFFLNHVYCSTIGHMFNKSVNT